MNLLTSYDTAFLQLYRVEVEIDQQNHFATIKCHVDSQIRSLKISVLNCSNTLNDTQIELAAKKVAVMVLKKELLSKQLNCSIDQVGFKCRKSTSSQIKVVEHKDVINKRKDTQRDYSDLINYLNNTNYQNTLSSSTDEVTAEIEESDEQPEESLILHAGRHPQSALTATPRVESSTIPSLASLTATLNLQSQVAKRSSFSVQPQYSPFTFMNPRRDGFRSFPDTTRKTSSVFSYPYKTPKKVNPPKLMQPKTTPTVTAPTLAPAPAPEQTKEAFSSLSAPMRKKVKKPIISPDQDAELLYYHLKKPQFVA